MSVLVVLLTVSGWALFKGSGRVDHDLAVEPDNPSSVARDLGEPDIAAPQSEYAEAEALARQIVSNEEWEATNDAWATTRGYDTVEPHWYKVDDSFAESQAISGDLGAQKYLAWKTIAADTSASMHWLREATLGGSTAALMDMAERSKLIAENRLSNPWPNTADISDFRVLSLAYALTAQLRGDHLTAAQIAARNTTSLKLSDEEIARACIRANELYEELAAERITRGMGAFDNSAPPFSSDPPNYDEFCTRSE